MCIRGKKYLRAGIWTRDRCVLISTKSASFFQLRPIKEAIMGKIWSSAFSIWRFLAPVLWREYIRQVAKEFRAWVQDIKAPEEFFYATMARIDQQSAKNPGRFSVLQGTLKPIKHVWSSYIMGWKPFLLFQTMVLNNSIK